MTLRSRLVLALVALTAIGLAVTALVTYHQVGSFLVHRVDRELASAAEHPNQHLRQGLPRPRADPPTTFRSARTPSSATLWATRSARRRRSARSSRRTSLPAQSIRGRSSRRGRRTTASRPKTHEMIPGDGLSAIPGTLIVAIPMRDIDDTLHHLLLIEVLVATGVLIALALLAWWVVHLGLRPLEEMSATADAIAAGDLSRRVDVADDRTEVGRLGLALNSMLGQIEQAFEARTASETRLRRFVADASHELRTPLTSIRGYAELFRRGAAARPDDLAKTMRRIEEAAARMGVLVDDLLLLARIDQGRPLELKPVDLGRAGRRSRRRPPRRRTRPPRRVRIEGPGRGERRREPPAPGARQPARERAHAHSGRRLRWKCTSGSPATTR